MSFVRLPILRHGLMARHEDILPDTTIAERIENIRQLMQTKKVESLLVYSDPIINGPVCYLTNYPCFGLGRRAAVVLGREKGPFLFTSEPSRNLPRVRRFTTCDLEKTRHFLSAACERAKKLSGGDAIGLVGIANMPLGLVKDTKEIVGLEVKDLSRDFAVLLAIKDEDSHKAMKHAIELAEVGIKFLKEQAASGKDLWQLAAYVDYRLRLLGCEDTNILLGCSNGRWVRPGYPIHIQPSPGGTMVAYIAVQYARHWGVVGTTISVRSTSDKLNDKLGSLGKVQNRLASEIRAGMILGQVEAIISEFAGQAGLTLAQDLPMATGVGFDLFEYPASTDDRVENNMILQVALAVDVDDGFTPLESPAIYGGDGEKNVHSLLRPGFKAPPFLTGFTAMLVNMLQITNNAGFWLSRTNTNA